MDGKEMEREQKALNAFVQMHAKKATQPKNTRVAHLAHLHPSFWDATRHGFDAVHNGRLEQRHGL